jgi:hypothetical protein
MADTSSTPPAAPALPSTADAVPYVPVSWFAVAAAACAGLFAVLLLVLGVVAFKERRPLVGFGLLFVVMAVVSLVLSFVARRTIRNSEGTRTGVLFGIDLPNAAWWTALVLLLGYLAYGFAIDYSIQQDAKAEVQRWGGQVVKGELAAAFLRTREPDQRKGMSPNNARDIEDRWGAEFLAFRQCDLVRVTARNPDQCQFEVGGVRQWSMADKVISCTVTGTLRCPEGVFPVQVALQATEAVAGTEGPVGRQWKVVLDQAGFVQADRIRVTPYGWLVSRLQMTGNDYGRQFLSMCGLGREGRLVAYLEYTPNRTDPFLRPFTPDGRAARLAVVGTTAGMGWNPGPEYFDHTADRLFTRPGGEKPTADQAKVFRAAWGTVGIVPPGSRISNSPDQQAQLTFTGQAVEVLVPVEIPLPSTSRTEMAAARGRIVVACTDPRVLADLDRLRKEGAANPDQTTPTPPDDIRSRAIPWTVLRVESDLQRVASQGIPGPTRPPGPGGMGGPGG